MTANPPSIGRVGTGDHRDSAQVEQWFHCLQPGSAVVIAPHHQDWPDLGEIEEPPIDNRFVLRRGGGDVE